ncbi:MAG TPA: TolC family protein [Tepidisphaeraceae bacterium]|jgi:outer membrane protein TolC|nr:TolC family protein [Tepidisphaeraceae bacterium]
MNRPIRTLLFAGLIIAAVLVLAGCVLAPKEAASEEARLKEAGAPYQQNPEKRSLPELPAQPTWRDVLHRAFLANGELEATYHEWAMAVSRIQQVGAYPNSSVSIGYEYMFSDESMKAWNRTTLSAGFDASESLLFPTKVYQSGKVATRDAQAAGERFAAAKFDLQRRVLNAWIDYALMNERVRIQRENASLLGMLKDTAAGRVRAGSSQQDLLRTDIEFRMSENELATMQSELNRMRSMLNAMIGREAEAPLSPPAVVESRPVPASDSALFEIGVSANPELKALAMETAGRKDALERARMEYIPDVNPFAMITGDVEKVLGADIMLPTVLPRINGMIKEARADLARVQAMTRQKQLDRAAEYVATVYALRNSERQASLFERQILPNAQRVLDSVRQSYTNGTGAYLDLIEAQRTLLNVQLTIAEAKAAREKSLADLEALAGIDFETLARPTTTPSTTQSTQPTTRTEVSP